ncbi:MAG: hypothetical protein JSV91_12060 [Phycisphaerales bacterium]|nr:MAG: hypothetical protein JSV91_12060 [Phycisphaerales bacterium]
MAAYTQNIRHRARIIAVVLIACVPDIAESPASAQCHVNDAAKSHVSDAGATDRFARAAGASGDTAMIRAQRCADNGIPGESGIEWISQERYVHVDWSWYGSDGSGGDQHWIYAPDFGPFDAMLYDYAYASQVSEIHPAQGIAGSGTATANSEYVWAPPFDWWYCWSHSESFLSVTFALDRWMYGEVTGELSYDGTAGTGYGVGQAELTLSGAEVYYFVQGATGVDHVWIDERTWLAPGEYELEVRAFANETDGPGTGYWWITAAFDFQMDLMVESPCPADLNGDWIVNIDDLFLVLAAWGLCDNPDHCPWDLAGPNNGPPDGKVNIDDVFAVLGAWGPCP